MKNWLQFLWIKAMDQNCYQQQHQTGSRPWLTKTPVPDDPWQSTTHATYTPPRNDLMKREGMNNYKYVAHEQLYRYRLDDLLLGTKWSFEGWMGRHCRYYSSLQYNLNAFQQSTWRCVFLWVMGGSLNSNFKLYKAEIIMVSLDHNLRPT
jgi:hypothetical protein